MKKLNLLLLSGICGFLLACTEVEEIIIIVEEPFEYIPCSIDVNTAGLPTTGADPLLAYQWYLNKSYIHEAWKTYETLPASDERKVQIQIAVVDDGLQVDHEDLVDNVISGASINVLVGKGDSNKSNPYPIDCAEDGHGTAVAGIIAASGDNGRGIKGIASVIAPGGNKIKIWGANLVSSSRLSDKMIFEVFNHRVTETAVSSNSWGPAQPTHLSQLGSKFKGRIDNGLKNGFGGKGISYVFAAGNERQDAGPKRYPLQDRASYSEILNQPGIIPVCAVDVNDKYAFYSEPGPNIWICGYSAGNVIPLGDLAGTPKGSYDNADNIKPKHYKFSGLPTTDLSGTNGYNSGANTTLGFQFDKGSCTTNIVPISRSSFNFASPNLIYKNTEKCPTPLKDTVELMWANVNVNEADTSYTRSFTGTSAATPMVSGVIGLIRSAYPKLTWRDIKLILAESAWQPPASTASVTTLKGAPAYGNDNHNYSHSPDYGFGIVNASAAMNLADGWTSLSGQPVEREYSAPSSTTIIVPDSSGISFIEYVQVEIGIEENSELDFGDLTITLTSPSPSNAVSVFSLPHECIDIKPESGEGKVSENCNDLENGFTFGSAVHLGESPMGNWGLSVTSTSVPNPAVNWKLRLYGH